MSAEAEAAFADIEATLKKVCAALREAQIPYLLGGSLASWARGGPETRHDLDFMIRQEDVDGALEALEQAGMRPERPPEEWLVKAWDGDVLVDLIHHPCGLPIDDEVLARGELMSVLSMEIPVMALEDVLVTKINALTEHSLRYESLLAISRALRERIDWRAVRERARDTAFARAFFVLLEGLGIIEEERPRPTAQTPRRSVDVRVIDGGHG